MVFQVVTICLFYIVNFIDRISYGDDIEVGSNAILGMLFTVIL